MKIDILSLFPEYFDSPLRSSILGRAIKRGLLEIQSRDIREFGLGKWKQVDDAPFHNYGMLLMAEPVVKAIRHVKRSDSKVVYLSPQGKLLTAEKSRELAKCSHLIFLCGHYEGVDERALESEVDEEISIGDYVLTNGGIAALVVIDALSRFIPGVLGNQGSADADSMENGLLEGPQYTRPRIFEGREVPEVLLHGDHQAISKWRKQISLDRTRERRPDLYIRYLYDRDNEEVTQQESDLQQSVLEAESAVILEVEDLNRSRKFYSKMFRLNQPVNDRLQIPGKTQMTIHLQEVGLKNKNIVLLSLRLDCKDDFFSFLGRWKMLGGTLEQADDRGEVRLVRDFDGHLWAISCKQAE
ncbi:tRNA (guanosine(37)-N1)-methyltransferase TrmD [Chlamydia psittaci]|uniref:tRNA (guanosine(37)-N1)-methyltransferase TrmD n=1 Tax=Chlamydia psittaci TaxID=83554 RepID=UPI00027E5780|nr:tRNA (guanosine(37)-N1)-methyltransferase TrmD [Chlamydia psittaci]AFS28212.1 tRNA (guanine-N1)-methyltransferase [Chlamydia psittaci NJ1]KPZ36055.1 tRNA (guanine-N1)-methyltransferase [Chlamydia psittaci NJ1]MDS0919240.1 tRNA (guanosine(37)-N1)-methyltransferase TrmD [Chlamydia psittaci]MDS0989271.1 tRNA (guanosine(37)-N1)-methyltransferase TrmD [Chlamydia psittaci]MDS0995246.1 tRNA (guanosine(37)-N1)-methyltransferase TrmD [Chlamydia psittaci]